MSKKLSGMLALLVSISVLATGCSSSKTETATSVSSPSESNTSQSSGDSKISPTEYELTITLEDNANQPISNYAPAQQEIFKETNIKLNFEVVSNSDYSDKKKVLLATDNLPDIIRVSSSDIVDYGDSGIFLPLTSYKSEMPGFYDLWTSTANYQNTMLDGELYGFPIICRGEAKNGIGPVIRTDLLTANNISTPKTFDELLTALEKLKEIYPDSVPWTNRKNTANLLKDVAYMLGSGYSSNGLYYDNDLGKNVYGPATTEFKKVLSYLNKAYEAGVLDPDYATTTQEQWTEKLTSGKSFFFIDNSGFSLNYTTSLQETEPDSTFQLINVPTNSTGKARALYYNTTFTGSYFAVSAKVKDPDTVVKFMNWCYTTDGSNITNFGVPGTSFELDSDGNPEFISDYVNQFKDATPTPYYAVYKELGITKLNFSPWACNTMTQFQIMKDTGNWGTLDDEYWATTAADPAYQEPTSNGPLTADESAKATEILTSLSTYMDQQYDKFIMGTEDIDQYDNVIAQAKSLGSTKLEDIYNEANERSLKEASSGTDNASSESSSK